VKRPQFLTAAHRLVLQTLAAFLTCSALADDEDYWDASIANPGSDGPVRSFVLDGNTVYAAGRFSQMNGVAANSIAKLDTNGWAPLSDGVTEGVLPTVFALAHFQGQIYAGGAFAQAGTIPANNIARWDGTNWFACGPGVGGIVRAMVVVGTRLIVGGSFNAAGGVPASNIAQWDGTNWSTLGSGVSWPYSGPAVDSLAADGSDLYVAGRFRMAGGSSATNVAKWNGTAWSALGKGLRHNDGPDSAGNGIVRGMVVNRGILFAGGEFSKAGDLAVTNIARWDGTNWAPFGGLGAVYKLVANGPDIFAGGWFSSYNHIAKWTGDGWVGLGAGIGGGAEGGAVWGLAANGSELFVGGPFGTAGGDPANNIAVWRIAHALTVSCAGETATLSWPATGTNFVLEGKERVADTNWTVLSTHPAVVGDQCRVTNQIDSPARFFRLRRR